jgi:hypothetical protein
MHHYYSDFMWILVNLQCYEVIIRRFCFFILFILLIICQCMYTRLIAGSLAPTLITLLRLAAHNTSELKSLETKIAPLTVSSPLPSIASVDIDTRAVALLLTAIRAIPSASSVTIDSKEVAAMASSLQSLSSSPTTSSSSNGNGDSKSNKRKADDQSDIKSDKRARVADRVPSLVDVLMALVEQYTVSCQSPIRYWLTRLTSQKTWTRESLAAIGFVSA